MKIVLRSLIVAMALGGATVAQAENWNGADEIARGNYGVAERVIVKQRQMFPTDVDLMLNLAVVYSHTHRLSEARALYLKVLSTPDEAMDLADGRPHSSHDMAKASLTRLNSAG